MAYGDIIRTFKDAPDTVLMEDTDGVRVIVTYLSDKISFSHNAEWIPEESMDWYAEVRERQLKGCFRVGIKVTEKKFKDALKAFIGIF